MFDQLPIYFGLNPRNWRMFYLRNKDKAFIRFKKSVLTRDRFTCRYCGFQSNYFMEVVNIDHDYGNNKMKNMATACPLCVQCCFLDMAGRTEHGGGVMIYLPNMSQNDLNGLCHVLFCALHNNTDYGDVADDIYKNLKLLGQTIENNWGKGLSQPFMLAQMLIDTPIPDSESAVDSMLHDCRLLPSRTGFKEQFTSWSANALEKGLTDPTF